MYRRLLVPIDGSDTSLLAVDEALHLAAPEDAVIVLLHIVDDTKHASGFEPPTVHFDHVHPNVLSAGQAVLDRARALLAELPVAVETVLLESRGERICELIVRHAAAMDAGLIVIGTHGRRGVNRLLLGSDAEQVARTAPVPVLLVRERREPAARQ